MSSKMHPALHLDDLINMGDIKGMVEAHFDASGTPIGIIDALDGRVLAAAGWQDICAKFHRVHPASNARCIECDLAISDRLKPGESAAYKCRNGLWDIGTPIIVDDTHLATMFLGQFLYDEEDSDLSGFKEQAEEFGFDMEEYMAALSRVPRFPRSKVEKILEYNKAFAAFLGHWAESEASKREQLAQAREAQNTLKRTEEQLALAMDMAHLVHWEMDIASGTFTFNEPFYALYGTTAEQEGGLRMAARTYTNNFVHPDDVGKVTKAVTNILEQDGVTEARLEHRILRRDGQERYIAVHYIVIRDQEGLPRKTFGVNQDITELRLTEDKLRTQANYLQTIIDTMPDGFCVIDGQGEIIEANNAYSRMSGYSREELLSMHISEMDAHDTAAQARERLRDIKAKGSDTFETWHQRKDGTLFLLELSTSFKAEPFDQFICFFRDITERRAAEEALEKRMVALTRPMDDSAKVDFDELFSVAAIQRLQDEFSDATGVASIITATDGTPITTPSNFCKLCMDIIRDTEQGRLNCYQSDAALGKPDSHGPTVRPCMSGGLWDAGAAISVGGHHVANWLIGQVRDETQTEDAIRDYAVHIGADEEAMVEAFREVPAMSLERFQQVAQVLHTLAGQLSDFAFQNIQQARFITDQKHTEQLLADSEERLSLALESVNDGLWDWRIDTGEFFYSPRWFTMLGYAPDAFPSEHETLLRLIHPEDLPAVDKAVSQVLNQGGRYQVEFRMRTNDGRWKWILARGQAVGKDASGKVLRVIGTHVDISQRKDDEEERTNIINELQDKTVELERFIYMISHDLKSPLITILGFLGIAGNDLAGGDIEKVGESHERIRTAAERMHSLLNELLEFSRIGRLDNPSEEMDLNLVVRETVEQVEGYAQRYGARITVSPNLPTVYGDRPRILEVFQNLLENGLKYSKDCESPEVSVEARTDTSPPVLVVRDNGIGIRAEYQDRIFNIFEQLDPAQDGSGIGLTMVRRIIELHGGSIWVESDGPGCGTAFCFTLPGKAE